MNHEYSLNGTLPSGSNLTEDIIALGDAYDKVALFFEIAGNRLEIDPHDRLFAAQYPHEAILLAKADKKYPAPSDPSARKLLGKIHQAIQESAGDVAYRECVKFRELYGFHYEVETQRMVAMAICNDPLLIPDQRELLGVIDAHLLGIEPENITDAVDIGWIPSRLQSMRSANIAQLLTWLFMRGKYEEAMQFLPTPGEEVPCDDDLGIWSLALVVVSAVACGRTADAKAALGQSNSCTRVLAAIVVNLLVCGRPKLRKLILDEVSK